MDKMKSSGKASSMLKRCEKFMGKRQPEQVTGNAGTHNSRRHGVTGKV